MRDEGLSSTSLWEELFASRVQLWELNKQNMKYTKIHVNTGTHCRMHQIIASYFCIL